MALLPSFGTRHRKSPFRTRYIVLVALALCVYFLFVPVSNDSSRLTSSTSHSVQETPFKNNLLWQSHSPSVAELNDKQNVDKLEAVAQLNNAEKDVSVQAKVQSGLLDPSLDKDGSSSQAKLVAEPTSGGKPIDEGLAEILRVHDSGDTIDTLQNKAVDKPLLDALNKANAGGAAGLVVMTTTKSNTASGIAEPGSEKEVVAAQQPDNELTTGGEPETPGRVSGAPPLPPGNAEVAVAKPTANGLISSGPQTEVPSQAGGVFEDFDFLFAFGDSWTTTSFDLNGPQPSTSNPFGNPDLPVSGETPPPEWLYYLTTKYNASYIRTYNIARGAATIDRAVVPPHPGFAFTWTFKEQASDAFGLAFSQPTPNLPWATRNTLFAAWFGIVDLALVLERGAEDGEQPGLWKDIASITQSLMSSYAQTLDVLYNFGARQFLLLNSPPLELMPDVKNAAIAASMVQGYNEALAQVHKQFSAKHSSDTEAEMYLFDVHALLAEIIRNPGITTQTQNLKNTTKNCWNYNPDGNSPKQPWDRFDVECGIPYNQYFWANTLHPTYPVHEAIAARIVSDCFAVKGKRSGFCS